MPVTNYIYDPVTEAYLMEQDGDGNTTVAYTQEPVKYGEVIAQHRIDPATGVGQSYYYHPDALGSTRELTDTNGEVVATYNYDAFGNTIASTGTVENPFRFTGNVGYYWDEELQTYHIRARNYQPTIGRWTSEDPIGFEGGINLYGAYFVPNGIDPSGEKRELGPGPEEGMGCRREDIIEIGPNDSCPKKYKYTETGRGRARRRFCVLCSGFCAQFKFRPSFPCPAFVPADSEGKRQLCQECINCKVTPAPFGLRLPSCKCDTSNPDICLYCFL